MSQPPTKRPRNFFIEQILEDQESTNQIGAGKTTKDAKDYVKKLNNEVSHMPKFQCLKSKTLFSIEDVPAEPEGLLVIFVFERNKFLIF